MNDIHKNTKSPILNISGLNIFLPDGRPLLEQAAFSVSEAETVVLLGGSGSGKSTLGRVLFDRDSLDADGFNVHFDDLSFSGDIGLVPQKGALFDHLDAAGNISIALRHASNEVSVTTENIEQWLEAVDLPASMASDKTKVGSLSGGQAQRLAVARTLAGGRKLLFLDEPSTGLDPHRVRVLADLINDNARNRGAGVIVVTHDVTLAALVADRIFFLDSASHSLRPLLEESWPGPLLRDDEALSFWSLSLEQEVVKTLQEQTPNLERGGKKKSNGPKRSGLIAPFVACTAAIFSIIPQLTKHPKDFFHILGITLRGALARPLLFYSIVSTLMGFTVLYVLVRAAPGGISAAEIVRMIGGAYIVALAPPLCAFLFTASSGGSINAWLGGMSLTKQIVTMKALGINTDRYLWAPVWFGLGIAFLVTLFVFGAGLFAGGLALCTAYNIPNATGLLLGDIFDPIPSRIPNLVRALWLGFIYAWGIASDVVAKGRDRKIQSDDVTASMIRSIIFCTLWVVALELTSAAIMFAWKDL